MDLFENSLGEYSTAPTQDRIFFAAVQLFSEKSYSMVSMRDIAKAVGIQVASIYHHYASKDDILQALYDNYEQQMQAAMPDIAQLLRLVETLPPHQVLMKLDFHYPPDVQEIMDRTLIIAATASRCDPRSMEFIAKNIFGLTQKLTEPLLRRMVELGRIAPLDIDAFCALTTNLSFSAAWRQFSPFPVPLEEWQTALGMLFSFIQPLEPEG